MYDVYIQTFIQMSTTHPTIFSPELTIYLLHNHQPSTSNTNNLSLEPTTATRSSSSSHQGGNTCDHWPEPSNRRPPPTTANTNPPQNTPNPQRSKRNQTKGNNLRT
ncbi:hypothetical protein Dimus_033316 [Dionaea muscipula]